jgi:hypothetical protein
MNSEVGIVRAAHPSSVSNTAKDVQAPDAGLGRILPVDPGFSIDSHMYMRQVKGEDIAFSYRADPSLLGRPMPSMQIGTPEEWKLNFDVFVLCDGHSGSQVRSLQAACNIITVVIQTVACKVRAAYRLFMIAVMLPFTLRMQNSLCAVAVISLSPTKRSKPV